MRFAARTPVMLALVPALACGGDVPVAPIPPSPTVSTAPVLSPGLTARLTGTHFAGATLVIDGITVPIASGSDTALSFVVPTLRSCETDGREATVVVTTRGGSATATTTMAVTLTTPVALGVGQSMALSLAVPCLQFPRDQTARYVLTWVNLDRVAQTDTLFTLTVGGGTGVPSAPVSRFALSPLDTRLHVDDGPAMARTLAPVARTSATGASAAWAGVNPATAVVGDTVRIVDFLAGGSNPPMIPLKVAAVVDYLVFLVDPRVPDGARIAADTVRLREAGEATVRTLVPALRQVFGADLQPILPGMNGRAFVVVTSMPDGILGTIYGPNYFSPTLEPRSLFANVVAISPTLLNGTNSGTFGSSAGAVASIVAHENTHILDLFAYVSEGKSTSDVKSAWYLEALASATQELAARMSMGTPLGASITALGPNDGAPFWGGCIWLCTNSFTSLLSPALTSNLGAYTLGSQLLLYARERLTQADYTVPPLPTTQTLWGQIKARFGTSPYDQEARTVDDVAAVLSLNGDDLLEQWALAVTLDDVVSPAIAAQEGIPQFASWNNTPTDATTFTSPQRGLSRAVSGTSKETLGGGAYNVRYINGHAAYGLSLTIAPKTGANYRLRLTRVR